MVDRTSVIKGLERYTADCVCTKCVYYNIFCVGKWCADALKLLKEQPEVVRCKDCKYGTLFQNAHGEWMAECENPDSPWLERLITYPDWFCADGEVKRYDH